MRLRRSTLLPVEQRTRDDERHCGGEAGARLRIISERIAHVHAEEDETHRAEKAVERGPVALVAPVVARTTVVATVLVN